MEKVSSVQILKLSFSCQSDLNNKILKCVMEKAKTFPIENMILLFQAAPSVFIIKELVKAPINTAHYTA